MSDPRTKRAEEALEAALAETGARDPREYYRERLRELKQVNRSGYDEAVAYYRDTLIPTIADGASPPLDAWTEYGRVLAQTMTPGTQVAIDESGRSSPYDGPDGKSLVLHLPSGKGRALLIALPIELSSAQRATYAVLVSGKQRLQSS